MCFWRNFSKLEVEPKPKLRTRDLRRFFDAIAGLKSDPELRVRYFEDPTLEITVEYYDPRRVWADGVSPSAHYLESKADGVIREGSPGFVIPTCDNDCDKRDAARHVAGLKKGVIVLPSDVGQMRSWYSDYNKSRLNPRLRHNEDFIADLRDRGLLVGSDTPPGDNK